MNWRSRNVWVVIFFLFGLIVYLYLTAFGFELRIQTNIWVMFIKFFVVILSLVLVFLLKIKLSYKFLGAGLVFILFYYMIPYTGLWKHSMNHYIDKNQVKYESFVETIREVDTTQISYFSCREEQFRANYLRQDSLLIANKLDSSNVCSVFNNLDAHELFIDTRRHLYLFSFSRFIDNGYGILYTVNGMNTMELKSERIDGLELRSIIKLSPNWFYVSYT